MEKITCLCHFRIQKQRLLELPHNYPRYQQKSPPEQTPETKRILDEINRINVQLGYVKKTIEFRPRFSVEEYFYPKQYYHPFQQQARFAETTSESLSSSATDFPNNLVLRQTVHKHSKLVPNQAIEQNPYYYPAPYLHLPLEDTAKSFTDDDSKKNQAKKIDLSKEALEGYMTIDKDITTVYEYAPGFFKQARLNDDVHREKVKMINSVKKIVKEMNDSKSPIRQEDNAILIVPKVKTKNNIKKVHQNNENIDVIVVSPEYPKVTTGEARATSKNSSSVSQTKTFLKPSKNSIAANVAAALSPSKSPAAATTDDKDIKASKLEQDYDQDVDDREPSTKYNGPFAHYFNAQKEQVVEALKQGGVIIQRLRVRNGGIAIAGPNGVATAGSGGTAIVGPGGIALTHPRSLSIAGPGARVISVPETIDLEQLALRSNARDLPLEGVLVATGPVVYYNPDTKS